MSWRSAVRAIARLGIIASVVPSGMTFGPGDAEARRGGRIRAAPHSSQDGGAPAHKSNGVERGDSTGHHTYVPVPRVRSRDAARGDGNPTTDAGAAAARRPLFAAPIAPISNKDIDVEGCGDGMICTVCLAGCYGNVGQIVDAQIKTPVPKPREE